MANCIYNGVSLPVLPTTDYSYVTIVHVLGGSTYRAIFSDIPMTIREVDDPQVMTWSNDTTISAYIYTQGESSDWSVDTDFGPVNSDEFWYYETYNVEWVWSNTEILDENGDTVYEKIEIEYTEITTKFDLRSWLAGYLVGVAGKELNIPKGTPISHLYGEDLVRVPVLPKWDETKYPHAYLQWCDHDFDYREGDILEPFFATLIVSDQPLFAAVGNEYSCLYARNPVEYMVCRTLDGEGSSTYGSAVWGDFSIESVDSTSDETGIGIDAYHVVHIYYKRTVLLTSCYDYRLLWANHDVKNLATNEVYFITYKPVPVYE